MNTKQTFHRVDIQALRGWAVLMVVLYHAKIGAITAGYLGVDVFFVVSGFLITKLVASAIERGEFRLANFYFRRAKRLLPAAYTTFAVAAALAPFFLNQQELRDFGSQVIGAVTFTENYVLLQQTGYFEGNADLKPLLHVWSLAIEEQYYLLLPAFLLFIRPSRWLAGILTLTLLSLVLCLLGASWWPVANFYILPTRAWELLIGSSGALWMLRAKSGNDDMSQRVLAILFVPSLLCLVLLPFFPFAGKHPGLNAMLICVATMVVILRDHNLLSVAFPFKFLARIGDFSYSLYLVHWPIIAFVKNAWVGANPRAPFNIRLATVLASFVVSYALYRFVEDPVRKMRFGFSWGFLCKVVFASALLALMTPAWIHFMPSELNFAELRRANMGLSDECEYAGRFTPRAQCQTGERQNLLIWGDSYAMHLAPGLRREWNNGGVIQATRSGCGPLMGLAPRAIASQEQGNRYDQAWAQSCIEFNQSVIDFLKQTPSIEVVVLSSPLSQYLDKEQYQHVIQRGAGFVASPVSSANVVAALLRTAQEVRALGKKVVLVAPPPSSSFDIGACLERQLSGAISLGGSPGCIIDRADYESRRADVLDVLRSIGLDDGVSVIRFEPWLCDATACKTLVDGTMVYRDAGHLSYAGSELMSKRMNLKQLIREQAR
ncbi:MAG: acyltransferase [Burkholderiales bacterium]|nr:acyltransferase [Burkholderiales bacterium]